MSYTDDLRKLFDECCAAGETPELSIEEFWEWCKENDKWSLPPGAEYKIFHRDAQQALRTAEYVNQQGVKVRAYGNFKDKSQHYLWFDVRSASRAKALAFFSEMYSAWQSDGDSLRKQIDNWNTNVRRKGDKTIVFDFLLPAGDEGESAA